MKPIPIISSLLASIALGQLLIIQKIPTEKEAALIARTLVNRESLTSINTLQDDGTPISLPEYYADCDSDGDPIWLAVTIGTTSSNIEKNSKFLFSIRAGDHSEDDSVDMNYPGSIRNSPAGSPRLYLTGELEELRLPNPLERTQLQKCFLHRHDDAVWWLPDNPASPHKSKWFKLHVKNIYMVGGFGDRAYIGFIDEKLYHEAPLLSDDELNRFYKSQPRITIEDS